MLRKNTPASERKIPAATATPAPRPSVENLARTSALASSISSRTMTVVRSATSPSVVARLSGRPSVATAAAYEGREDEAAQERGADEHLGMALGERGGRADRLRQPFQRGRRRDRLRWLGGGGRGPHFRGGFPDKPGPNKTGGPRAGAGGGAPPPPPKAPPP